MCGIFCFIFFHPFAIFFFSPMPLVMGGESSPSPNPFPPHSCLVHLITAWALSDFMTSVARNWRTWDGVGNWWKESFGRGKVKWRQRKKKKNARAAGVFRLVINVWALPILLCPGTFHCLLLIFLFDELQEGKGHTVQKFFKCKDTITPFFLSRHLCVG